MDDSMLAEWMQILGRLVLASIVSISLFLIACWIAG
jgi:hypothetical protein